MIKKGLCLLLTACRASRHVWLVCLAFALVSSPVTAAEKIRIGASTGVSGVLLWLAQETGAFRNKGLDIELVPYQAGKIAVAALESGEVDLANGADFVLAKRSFEKKDLRVVSILSESALSGVVVRRDRGIKSASDLRGRRIAVTLGSTGEFFLARLLLAEGIGLDEVTLVAMKPKAMAKSLESGAVDAVSTWDPYVYASANAIGDDGLVLRAGAGQDYFFLLLASDSWLSANKEAARGIVAALADTKRLLESPAGAKLLLEFYNRTFKLDRKYARYVLQRSRSVIGLSQPLLTGLEIQARWIMSTRAVPSRMPNYLDHFYFDALESAAPEYVSVLR